MNNIIIDTLRNAEPFWSAIAALSTLGAFLFILYELPKIRGERAARNIEGLKFTIEQLNAKDFKSWEKMIIDTWKKEEQIYPSYIEDVVFMVLTRLGFISKLIKMGYIDKDFFLYMFAEDLHSLESALRNFESREGSQIKKVFANARDGYTLLKDAGKAASKSIRESIDRVSKVS